MKKKIASPLSAEDKEQQYRIIFEAAGDGMIISDIVTGCVVDANPAAIAMHGYTRDEFIGLHLTAYIHSDSQRLFVKSATDTQPGIILDTPAVHLYKDGSSVYVEVRRTPIPFQGRLCLLSVVRNVSERINAERVLNQRSELHAREQAMLLTISHTLASTLELQPGLILDQLHEIIKYTHGGLFALEGSMLVTLAMRGTSQLEQSAPIFIHSNTPGNLATLFNRHRPTRIADVWSDDPQAIFLRSFLDDGAALLLEDMQSWMWVPLAVRGRIIGCIGIAESSKDYFTVHHAELALSVANQAAITMINAELYSKAKDLAVLEERQNLARNLHDAVNQSLFSASLIAEVLPRLWDKDQQEARRSLEDLRRLTRGAMAEMRAMLAELRPSTIIDSSLSDLLRLLGNAFSGRTNVPITVNVSGEFFLPAEAQVTFYRVCQEALNNIAKHAKATQVEIELKQEEEVIEMHIQDNGLGFDPTKTLSGHYGLGMMRERAEAADASLTITSQPGRGTELTIRWTQTPPKESL
ncbi:MAG: PAS domain S-box protein [Chloroflexi bacterium]|nr:PAS domain S-box protein [Chloroflexota bacterium]